MATYSRQPVYAAAMETARELAKKRDPNAIRKPTGVGTLEESERELGERAVEGATKLEGTQLDLEPIAPGAKTAEDDKGQAVGQKLLTSAARDATSSGRGTEDMKSKIEEAAKKAAESIAKQTEGMTTELEDTRETRDKFIDKTLNSTTAMGQLGEMSTYQAGDLQLAEMMADPTSRTSDIGVVSEMLPKVDPRLRALASQVYQKELNMARGDAAAALTGYGEAQAGADTQIEGMFGAGEEARDRIGEQYAERLGDIDTFSQEAMDEAQARRQASMDALSRGVEMGKQDIAKRVRAKEIQNLADEAIRTRSMLSDGKGISKTHSAGELKDHYGSVISNIRKLEERMDKAGVSQAERRRINDQIELTKQRLQQDMQEMFNVFTEGVRSGGMFGGSSRDRSKGVEWQTSGNAKQAKKVYNELKEFLKRS